MTAFSLHYRQILEPVLRKGEEILWADSPASKAVDTKKAYIVIIGILWTLIGSGLSIWIPYETKYPITIIEALILLFFSLLCL